MECLFEQVNITSSTNQDLMTRWRNDELIKPTSRMAIHQTSGKGRRGNPWVAQQGHSLTFSLAYCFHPKTSLQTLQPLSLVVGFAILEGIALYWDISRQALSQLGLGLKWPNDIYLGEAKIGGILIETGQKNPSAPLWTIIGVGLNLYPISTPIESSYPIAALNQIALGPKKELNATQLWHFLSKHLIGVLSAFTENGHEFDYMNWNDVHVYHHQEVNIMESSKVLHSGKIVGVSPSGALLLETPLGLQPIHSGHVSLRI